ncbi:hypothetical protein, partial [Planobispora longispora]|uniref:hypothetical protein n=1 Tax=Planobispora longispora TaxID=28887 RepID=UPI0035EB4D32
GIFIVLSGFATSDLSVDFCDARQGGGAYGKTPATEMRRVRLLEMADAMDMFCQGLVCAFTVLRKN